MRYSFLMAIMVVVAVLQLSPTFACGIDEPGCRAAANAPAASAVLDALSQSMIWWVGGAALVLMISAVLIVLARRRAR